MTDWQVHVQQWAGCTRCELARGRRRPVVLGKGQLPADVFFCGEAPGQSEDVLGDPFEGPAGHLLDWIIRQAVPPSVTYAIGNLVGCLPRDEGGSKVAQPPEEAIQACKPRVQDLVRMCQPRLIVRVGKLATDYLTQGYKYSVKLPDPVPPMVDILHPAAILRMPYAARRGARQRCVVVVRNAVEEYLADK